MKKIVASIIILILTQSCTLLFPKVECREYKVGSEKFWFQGDIGSKYTLVNNKTQEEKTFTLRDRTIFTELGCGCRDKSLQELTTDRGTISLENKSVYWGKSKPTVRSVFTFKLGKQDWVFNNETSTIKYGTKIINGKEINTITYTDPWADNTEYVLVLGEGVGIISVKISKDEQWDRKSLKVENIVPTKIYKRIKSDCKKSVNRVWYINRTNKMNPNGL